jgi:hypothetical protein
VSISGFAAMQNLSFGFPAFANSSIKKGPADAGPFHSE